jgi:hypothetical protein
VASYLKRVPSKQQLRVVSLVPSTNRRRPVTGLLTAPYRHHRQLQIAIPMRLISPPRPLPRRASPTAKVVIHIPNFRAKDRLAPGSSEAENNYNQPSRPSRDRAITEATTPSNQSPTATLARTMHRTNLLVVIAQLLAAVDQNWYTPEEPMRGRPLTPGLVLNHNLHVPGLCHAHQQPSKATRGRPCHLWANLAFGKFSGPAAIRLQPKPSSLISMPISAVGTHKTALIETQLFPQQEYEPQQTFFRSRRSHVVHVIWPLRNSPELHQ